MGMTRHAGRVGRTDGNAGDLGPRLEGLGPDGSILNRVHFENRGYASPEPGNTPVHGASGQNCGTTVSKLDAV
jgi:hypothetical protein